VKILALDVSTQNVGWCAGVDDEYVVSGCLSPSGDVWERLRQIAVDWEERALSWQWQFDVVAFEEPRGQHHNMDTNIKLGYANGLVLAPFLARGAEPLPVHIRQIKATGVHKHTTRVAAGLVGKDTVGPDEADAIGCWLAAQKILKERRWEELADEQM
jgi:Holliday junction resolvasome RuvABC endonuclease subunit